MKVSVCQIQRHELVPWAYLREDPFQSAHPERPFYQGMIPYEGGRALVGGLMAPREKPLRDGSSGGDHSSPSSLTDFDMTRTSSSSVLCLALCEEDSGKRSGSVKEPDNSFASKVARERLSSISPSLPPNEIMLFAAAEGH